MHSNIQTKWLDSLGLAKELSISRRTVEQWRVIGEGPNFFKIGRLVRYRRADVDEWLESRVRDSTSDTGR